MTDVEEFLYEQCKAIHAKARQEPFDAEGMAEMIDLLEDTLTQVDSMRVLEERDELRRHITASVPIPVPEKDVAIGIAFTEHPGCFSAGDTIDEALVNAKEAFEVWNECNVKLIDDDMAMRATAYEGQKDAGMSDDSAAAHAVAATHRAFVPETSNVFTETGGAVVVLPGEKSSWFEPGFAGGEEASLGDNPKRRAEDGEIPIVWIVAVGLVIVMAIVMIIVKHGVA